MFNQKLAGLELLLAAALWGFGFVASVWAMESLDPFALTFSRFFLASLLLLPLLAWSRWRQQFVASLRPAFWPGVFFAATILVQTWGLRYTTATKSGFLTTLYVVLVPCLESYLGKHRLPMLLWACVATSFVGTLMIANTGLHDLNKGDLLTVICAVLATGQIYVIGLVSPRVPNPLVFNAAQTLWAALVCAPFGARPESLQPFLHFSDWSRSAQVGLLSLVVGSTVVAFTLQVRAQARLRPTISSLLFLLESPFAMLFAMLFLREFLGPWEACGAALILLSALVAGQVEWRLAATAKNG